MPITVLFAYPVALLAISIAIWAVALYLAARLFRAQAFTWRRATGTACGASLFAPAVILTEFYAPMLVLQVLVGVLSLVITVAAAKIGTRLGWWRTLGALAVAALIQLGLGLAVTATLKATLIQSYVMSGEAMKPVLADGDRFLVDRLATPARWDIIVFAAPPNPRIVWAMRVVGLPGENVEVRNGNVLINGVVIEKPSDLREIGYENPPRFFRARDDSADPALTLGPDEYFVLGDNQAGAMDSRVWGPAPGHRPAALPAANIIGVARLIYAPADRTRVLD